MTRSNEVSCCLPTIPTASKAWRPAGTWRPVSTWRPASAGLLLVRLKSDATYSINNALIAAGEGRTYDVSPDGKRFLTIKPSGGPEQTAASTSLIVVQNWFEELKRLVPRK